MGKKALPLKNPVEFGQRLRQARKSALLKLSDVGLKLGVSYQSVKRWEEAIAEPPLKGIIEMAKIYSVSIDWLLLGEERANGPPPHHALIRLPAGDADPAQYDEVELLERTLMILRAKGEAATYSKSLKHNINAFHKGVKNSNELAGLHRELSKAKKVNTS